MADKYQLRGIDNTTLLARLVNHAKYTKQIRVAPPLSCYNLPGGRVIVGGRNQSTSLLLGRYEGGYQTGLVPMTLWSPNSKGEWPLLSYAGVPFAYLDNSASTYTPSAKILVAANSWNESWLSDGEGGQAYYTNEVVPGQYVPVVTDGTNYGIVTIPPATYNSPGLISGAPQILGQRLKGIGSGVSVSSVLLGQQETNLFDVLSRDFLRIKKQTKYIGGHGTTRMPVGIRIPMLEINGGEGEIVIESVFNDLSGFTLQQPTNELCNLIGAATTNSSNPTKIFANLPWITGGAMYWLTDLRPPQPGSDGVEGAGLVLSRQPATSIYPSALILFDDTSSRSPSFAVNDDIGATGSFTTEGGQTVTVKGGLIVDINPSSPP